MDFGLDLVLIPLAAVLAPLLARGLGRWVPIPVVVFAAAVLVGAGMLSMLVYPLIGMSLRHERVDPGAAVADEKL